jgi:cytochrome c
MIGSASAQPVTAPSADRGRDLAQRLCSSCHLTPDAPIASVPASVPPLRAIANRPGQTGDNIILTLMRPHAPMPDLSLTRIEILDLLFFLETLRTDKAAPPFKVPEELNEKPKYPKPS